MGGYVENPSVAECSFCDASFKDLGPICTGESRLEQHMEDVHSQCSCGEWYDNDEYLSTCDGDCYKSLCESCYTKSCGSCHCTWHEDCAPDFGSMNGEEYCENCISEMGGHLDDHFSAQSEHGHGGWENA
jgi:hypothetical protein